MIYTSYIRLYVERISSDARKVGEISERAKSADSAAKRVFRFRGVRRVKREKGKKGKIAGLTCSGKHTIGDEREKISVEEGGRDGANDARSRVGTGGREDRKNIGRSGINRFQRRGSFVKRNCGRVFAWNVLQLSRGVRIGCFAFEDSLLALMPRSQPSPSPSLHPDFN